MKLRLWPRKVIGVAASLSLLVACSADRAQDPTPQSIPTLERTATPTRADETATPDPCTGWECTLTGVVYVDEANPGNELAGTPVELSHVTNCSPTRGQHTTTTNSDGSFEFAVFLHDTDTFWIEVELAGYETVRRSVGGFDCLYCACPPVEIVLKRLGAATPAP